MEIILGIASTTNLDKQNEKMSKGCLEGMAEQVNEKFVSQLIEHDFENQRGIVLYGEVFELPDGEFALGTVIGIFESFSEKTFYKNGEKNYLSDKYKEKLDIKKLINMYNDNNKVKVKKSFKKDNTLNIKFVKDLEKFNKNGNFYSSINVLKEFLIDEGTEAFIDGEDNFFGIDGNSIIIKKHLVENIDKSKIEIYSNEHPPAHFHLNIAEYKGSYEISSCNKMEGNIPRKYEKKLILWYKNGGKEKLIDKWNNTRPENCVVGTI